MGKRTLRHWLCYPLADKAAIQERQRVVSALVNDSRFADELGAALDGVQDVQRILGRIAVGRATPRDLVALGLSAWKSQVIADLLSGRPSVAEYAERAGKVAPALTEMGKTIAGACVDTPPQHLREGGLIRDGFDAALDESRALQVDSHTWLAGYQKSLIEQTSIPNLKVGFNKVFGYYIELTAGQRDKAPVAWSRKQTLKNAERFVTPELKEYEGKVLTARDRAVAREQELFAQLCDLARSHLLALQGFAELVAELDVLACFAKRAVKWRYVCPKIVDEPVLQIHAGRHPVLDELLGDQFVPNDIELGRGASSTTESPTEKSATLALITGPNMAGKSTYIRTAALLTLLAHTGSFVPADSATVGLTDRIFTRIGASDELHTGASTFMVEMTETANICHHASPKSLVILDEIGRGTSTLDGLSLAWAIAEHIASTGCRSLFATHYHELTALAERFENVTNLSVTVREWNEQIVFLHRIARGATDRSYGIHVAKIAGLPSPVVARANELLSQLAVSHSASPGTVSAAAKTEDKKGKSKKGEQMSLFTEYLDHPAIEQLRKVDMNQLSPLQAFETLRKLREQLER
jgi:DNA mismatch repair protein MutS